MLISVCIPCHNAARFLAETLQALLNQCYRHFEIIIIDDHSIDESVKVIQEFVTRDKRIITETAKGKGAAAARNQAYKLSKGDYIIFFDADDWIPEDFIETQLNSLRSDQEVVVAKWGRYYGSDLSTINIDVNQIQKDLSFEEWVKNYWTNISHMTCPGRVLVPRNLINLSGSWDEDLSLNDDFTFYTRIFSNSQLIRFNGDSLFHYRSGINGLSSKRDTAAYQSLYNSLVRSIAAAQYKLKEHEELNLSYANLLQNFIYEAYPNVPMLINQANSSIKDFGGSDLIFPAGGTTKLFNYLLGWKLVKKIKTYMH